MDELHWDIPKQTPGQIVDRYVDLVRTVPGPIQVWARVDGSTLHLISLIDESDEAERALYEAERNLLSEVEPGRVSFEVHRTTSPAMGMPPECAAEEASSKLVLQSS